MEALEKRVLDGVSLGDFVKMFIAKAQTGLLSGLPYHDSPIWHRFFYGLREAKENKPKCISDLRFNWDAPYPKAGVLSHQLWFLQVYAPHESDRENGRTLYANEWVATCVKSFDRLDDPGKDYLTKTIELFSKRHPDFLKAKENVD